MKVIYKSVLFNKKQAKNTETHSQTLPSDTTMAHTDKLLSGHLPTVLAMHWPITSVALNRLL